MLRMSKDPIPNRRSQLPFGTLPKRFRFSLWTFFQVVKVIRWRARRRGVELESRLRW
jgi:hypothetical protein